MYEALKVIPWDKRALKGWICSEEEMTGVFHDFRVCSFALFVYCTKDSANIIGMTITSLNIKGGK
ncbi:hypothetical protein CHH75_06180 [Paenibacillus sp. 7541]|nr:hypothetical protein CHH75_06180 [Paenibacillus sp. 7541]